VNAVSSLIEFLMDLLRDEEAQAEFARDPQAMLAQHGLAGVTAQDICEAQPVLADHPAVRHVPHDGGGGGGGGGWHPRPHHDDPVREIHHVVNTHTVDTKVIVKTEAPQYNTYNEYNAHYSYTDNSITADTVIQDSFNQDNDGVDNKGGVINDSNVANGDQTDVGNTDIETDIDDSFNEDNSDTDVIVDSGNDTTTTTTTATDSFDTTTTTTATEVNGSYNADNSITAVSTDDDALADATV
jgi:hypothetical protein